MYQRFKSHLESELSHIREAGLFKNERIIISPQGAMIQVADGKEVLNFCANNYLGLSNNPELIRAAKNALDTHGYGMSSVRFICGTQNLHKELEARIAQFFRDGGHHSIRSLFRCQWWSFRTAFNRRRCYYFRCAQPCVNH